MVDLETLRHGADLVIRRGCGFGTIGIVTMMVGLVGLPGQSMQCGAILFGLMAAILAIKAGRARSTNYRRTELWLLLRAEPPALPPERLQQLIGGVLAERFAWHAKIAACIAAVLFVAGILGRLLASG